MYLVVTIDTEEDNWGEFERRSFDIENVKKIPRLQKLFDEFGIRPTYLVTYPVVEHPESAEILARISGQNKCEIGMHCHPWNTPPYEEKRTASNSMLCNLPIELQRRKLAFLHEQLEKKLQVRPTCFRAGRWGYGASVSVALRELGYCVDTSISPFTNWSDDGGPDFSSMPPGPYRFQPPNIKEVRSDGEMIEIPATIDYLRGSYEFCKTITPLLQSRFGRTLRVNGILRKLRLLRKVWLSPENSGVEEMAALTQRTIRQGCPVLNMFFHSTALLAGLSPFVRNVEEESRFLKRLKDYFYLLRRWKVEPVTLSEAAARVCP